MPATQESTGAGKTCLVRQESRRAATKPSAVDIGPVAATGEDIYKYIQISTNVYKYLRISMSAYYSTTRIPVCSDICLSVPLSVSPSVPVRASVRPSTSLPACGASLRGLDLLVVCEASTY